MQSLQESVPWNWLLPINVTALVFVCNRRIPKLVPFWSFLFFVISDFNLMGAAKNSWTCSSNLYPINDDLLFLNWCSIWHGRVIYKVKFATGQVVMGPLQSLPFYVLHLLSFSSAVLISLDKHMSQYILAILLPLC